MHSKQKEVRSSTQIFNLSWNDTQDWIFKIVKNEEKKSFFKKREKDLALEKFSCCKLAI